MAFLRNLILCAYVFCGLGASKAQQVDWPSIEFREVVTNRFEWPVAVTHAGDGSGRLFVGEARGRVWIVKDGARLASPFLDISDRMGTLFEGRGLLSLAFPPGFAGKQHFYALYATDSDVVLSRFGVTLNPNVAGSRTEEVILRFPEINASNHGGQLAFGPDGFLYVGVSDFNRGIPTYPEQPIESGAQDKGTLHGKILRIDVESAVKPYGTPATNPFVNVAGARGEIWALGFQDPWRFSFDRLTGDFYIADNGNVHFQEINFQAGGSAGGQNYGWPLMEGPAVRGQTEPTNWPGLVSPIVWFHSRYPSYYYDSVTGGFVYRGPNAPRMEGVYFYADSKQGSVWGAKRVNGIWRTQPLMEPSSYLDVKAFGEDEAGRLYAARFYGGMLEEIVDGGKVLTPTFDPEYVLSSDRLKIQTATPGAEIHYTLNGADPTLADPVVPANGEIQVLSAAQNNRVTVRARAFRSDLEASKVATQEFVLRAATPVFSPMEGEVLTNAFVTLSSATPGARIFYRLTGVGDPSAAIGYTAPFQISNTVQFVAHAVAPGFEESAAAWATFWPAKVAMPHFNSGWDGITNGTKIRISTEREGELVYYTLDGSTPTRSSLLYSSPVSVNIGTTLKAFAVREGHLDSEVNSHTFVQGTTAAPEFDPPGGDGALDWTRSFSLSSTTPGAQIYYTFDMNAGPGEFVPYTGPVAITNDVFVRAYATAPGLKNSGFVQTTFTYPRSMPPWFTPVAGPLTNGAKIAIEYWIPAEIRYTTDGSTPTKSSPLYTGPITFTGPMELKAAVFEEGFISGQPGQEKATFFGELIRTPTVVTTFAGGGGSTNSGYADGPLHMALFAEPMGVCVDASGNLYVADTWNNAVRKISTNGIVSTIAATFEVDHPIGVAVDAPGNVYVSELDQRHRIMKIAPDGVITTVATLEAYSHSRNVGNLNLGPDGNLYAGLQSAVWKVTLAGNISEAGGPYPLEGAVGGYWMGLLQAAVDQSTNVFAAYGRKIWRTAANGSTELYAGAGATQSDGPRASAGFAGINGLAINSGGTLYLTEKHWVRRLGADGATTLAGAPGEFGFGYRNGRGEEALFTNPRGLCVDARGNVYVADSYNNCIRKISPDTAGIGISDEWQLANFGSVGIDPNGDADTDGASNYEEFWAGTNPKGADSGLRTEPITFDASGHLVIRWQTVLGKNYLVEFSADLETWEAVGDEVVGNGEIASVVDPNVPDRKAHWFYRVRALN